MLILILASSMNERMFYNQQMFLCKFTSREILFVFINLVKIYFI